MGGRRKQCEDKMNAYLEDVALAKDLKAVGCLEPGVSAHLAFHAAALWMGGWVGE